MLVREMGKEMCFVKTYKFKGEFYVKLEDFEEVMGKIINVKGENRSMERSLQKLEKEKDHYYDCLLEAKNAIDYVVEELKK